MQTLDIPRLQLKFWKRARSEAEFPSLHNDKFFMISLSSLLRIRALIASAPLKSFPRPFIHRTWLSQDSMTGGTPAKVIPDSRIRIFKANRKKK